jgi:hypothetical protein
VVVDNAAYSGRPSYVENTFYGSDTNARRPAPAYPFRKVAETRRPQDVYYSYGRDDGDAYVDDYYYSSDDSSSVPPPAPVRYTYNTAAARPPPSSRRQPAYRYADDEDDDYIDDDYISPYTRR